MPDTASLPAEVVNAFAEPDWPVDGWYAAARSEEVGPRPLARTVCGHNLVLFWSADGGRHPGGRLLAHARPVVPGHRAGRRELLGDGLGVFAGDEGARADPVAEVARLSASGAAYVCGPLGFIDDRQKTAGEGVCACVSRVTGGDVIADTGPRGYPERVADRAVTR